MLDRLAGRRAEPGSSDADRMIYRGAVEAWEEPSGETAERIRPVDTGGDLEASVEQAIAHLREAGLA